VAQPAADDDVVVEEPLEIRAAGDTLAVTMRTPGYDRELAIGFLFAEGVIASRDDVSRVAHCGRPDQEGFGNTIDVAPAAGAEFDVERVSLTRRGTLTTAACGVCGRRSVQDVIDRCAALPDGPVLEAAAVAAAMEKLRSFQPNFSRTGGIHAAAALDGELRPMAAFEDIGRHNAVDKAVGSLLIAGTLGRSALLVVSSRAGFEIVQKATSARIPVVASVSAPSSLAIDLARAMNITLCGFVRNGSMSVYAHPERLGA
jgi:FdhD protein